MTWLEQSYEERLNPVLLRLGFDPLCSDSRFQNLLHRVGKFYRPPKKPVTMRLDIDIIKWPKSRGRGYQTSVNALLQHAMNSRWAARNENEAFAKRRKLHSRGFTRNAQAAARNEYILTNSAQE